MANDTYQPVPHDAAFREQLLSSAWPKKQKIKTPAKSHTKFQTEIG